MRNKYRVEGQDVWIELTRGKEVVIELADLPILLALDCRWYANPCKSPKGGGKFYAVGTHFDWERMEREGKKPSQWLAMHRVILGLTDPEVEGHHKDNDGLNNRRSNLEPLDHRSNLRERDPERDWAAWDAHQAVERERIAKFKRLVEIGKGVAADFNLSRQAMWNIRVGISGSKAAEEYWRRVRVEFAELFPVTERRHPGLVIRPFTKAKPRKVVVRKAAPVKREGPWVRSATY